MFDESVDRCRRSVAETPAVSKPSMDAGMGQSDRLPKRPFRAIIFDWDGTAVATRQEDASALDALIRALLARGAWIVVVTGTNFQNIDRQLGRTLDSVDRGRLLVCTNRGSEVYGFDRQ